jgi:cellulose synthase (UDP-forming)
MSRSFYFLVWTVFAVLTALLVAQPIGVDGQMTIALSAIALMTALLLFPRTGFWRHVFLAIGSIVVLRYAFWRTTNTLPPVDDLASFIPGLVLYLGEMYCLVMLAISLFVVSDPIEREAAPKLAEDELPTVDVFVPSYNESREILGVTLSAAKAMRYPRDKLRVHLLDDGGTDEKQNSSDPKAAALARRRSETLRELCRDLDVVYMTRPRNIHAKAGNLNSGLERTDGELVVVFDADHAPERNFLEETVGFFARDAKLFLVQTPHFFSNPDPIERNLGTFETMPSENEMFYGNIQMGLDKWNASFFCGSAAVLRREALEQVGGFAGITITEDCETALELHARGWNSVYVNKPLISGLQPETFASFIGQRSRWCRGMVQILLLKNPLLKQGLTLPQRLSYLSSSLFWFFPFARVIFLVAPLLFILFDLKIYVASLQDFVAYTLTYLVVGEMIRNYLYGKVRWPWISELYEYVQSVYLFGAIWSVILNPRKPTFNVTAKGETLKEDRLSELSWPYFAIFGILCVALAVSVYRYQTEPEISGLLLIVGAWNWLNLIMAGVALGVVTERKERRGAARLASNKLAELGTEEETILVSVSDVSMSGAAITPIGAHDLAMRRGDRARIQLIDPPGDVLVPSVPVTLVNVGMGAAANEFGLRFDAEAHHYHVIANLMVADLSMARNKRAARQKRKGILSASLRFAMWSLRCPINAVVLFLNRGGTASDDQASAALGKQTRPAPVPAE